MGFGCAVPPGGPIVWDREFSRERTLFHYEVVCLGDTSKSLKLTIYPADCAS